MIQEGLQIMVVGMLTVFCFLWLMVVVMNAAGRVLGRWGGDDEGAVGLKGADNGAGVAAVIAAVQAHTDRSVG